MQRAYPEIHTLLILPPVWTPIYPYLALPVLTGYLRQRGCSVSQYDASLEFFLDYLFSPSMLRSIWDAVNGEKDSKNGKELIDGVDQIFLDFRDPSAFFRPDRLIKNQQKLRILFRLISSAYRPASFTFNQFLFPEIWSVEEMTALCDAEENPFLPFCRNHLAARIDKEGPRIVGISLSTRHQLIATLTMSRFIKKHFPDIHVVIGGKHCLALHQKFIQNPLIFREFFDSLIPRQGEGPLYALIEAFSSRRGPDGVQGLSYHQDGTLRTSPTPAPLPLRSFPPPDFEGLDLERYLVPRPYLPLRLSEGCYWGKCSFCSRYYHRHFEFLPVEKAVDHIERIQRSHGTSDISINDDCLPPSYLEALCRELLRREIDISMLIWGKPVDGFTRRRLEILRKAGVKEIRWGIETGNRRILKLMNKGTDLQSSVRVLEDATRLGIWNHACMILGFPTETREEAEETLSWLKEHKDLIHSYYLFDFYLYHESYIYCNPGEFAIDDVTMNQSPFSNLVTFSTKEGMSRDEVSELIRGARRELLEERYKHPFWYYLRDREYLQFYLDRFGLEGVRNLYVNHADFSVLSPSPL